MTIKELKDFIEMVTACGVREEPYKVAELLRKLDIHDLNDYDDEIHSLESAIECNVGQQFESQSWLHRLADLIDPTCNVVGTISMDWSDGLTVYEHELSCGHTCRTVWQNPPAYCDKCGARVVDDAQ